ncbi:MAG: hypothetical protein WKF78_13870 [Candidatus Limnocylindrales bacterium]
MTIAERVGEVDQTPQERLGLVGRKADHFEDETDVEANDAAALSHLGLARLRRELW